MVDVNIVSDVKDEHAGKGDSEIKLKRPRQTKKFDIGQISVADIATALVKFRSQQQVGKRSYVQTVCVNRQQLLA